MKGCGLSQSSRQMIPPPVPAAPITTQGPESVLLFTGHSAPGLRFFLLQFPRRVRGHFVSLRKADASLSAINVYAALAGNNANASVCIHHFKFGP